MSNRFLLPKAIFPLALSAVIVQAAPDSVGISKKTSSPNPLPAVKQEAVAPIAPASAKSDEKAQLAESAAVVKQKAVAPATPIPAEPASAAEQNAATSAVPAYADSDIQAQPAKPASNVEQEPIIATAKDNGARINDNPSAEDLQKQWQDSIDPIASADAVPGGTIVYAAAAAPKSLNPYLDNNTFSYQVFGAMYETLLSSDPLTGDYAPGLARRWEISKDKRSFTFHLDPLARWSDGERITAEDVLWTFQTIMARKSQTGPHKVALKTFLATPPEILNPLAIRFTAEDVHWRNLGTAGGFEILPKHVFEKKDFNKINTDFPVVSGPYKLTEIKEGVSITLQRRSDWWARARSASRNTYNFDKVVYRFFAEQDNAFDAFLAGQIDVFPVYKASIWTDRTKGKKFDNNWIVKRRIINHHPIGFQGFAMNMRRAPFDDVLVRRAFAHLLDRKRMVETMMHNQYFLHKSYFEGLYDASNTCNNATYDFDPEKAAALLDEAGWEVDSETGLRKKDGKTLSFTFLTRDESSDKFLALYGEDLKKAGIEMKIERKDWAAWTRDMGAYQFDMTWAAWSSGIYIDPESMWSSKEADQPNGNNITGFKDAMVDQLIDVQRSIFDLQERNNICRRIDRILTEKVPYILLWNLDAVRLLYWDKFGMPPTVLSRFGDERSLLAYWWYDADSADDLASAIEEEDFLPAPPDFVDFDQTFEFE